MARDAERSEDAFDAAVSALVMAAHAAELAALAPTHDPQTLLEGAIWYSPRALELALAERRADMSCAHPPPAEE